MNAQEMQPADHGLGCPLRGVAGVIYLRRPECRCSIIHGEPVDLEPEVVHPRRIKIPLVKIARDKQAARTAFVVHTWDTYYSLPRPLRGSERSLSARYLRE